MRTNLQSSSLPVGGSSILLNSSIRFRESVCRMHFQTNVTTQRSYPAALGSSLFCSLEPLVRHCPVGGARAAVYSFVSSSRGSFPSAARVFVLFLFVSN